MRALRCQPGSVESSRNRFAVMPIVLQQGMGAVLLGFPHCWSDYRHEHFIFLLYVNDDWEELRMKYLLTWLDLWSSIAFEYGKVV